MTLSARCFFAEGTPARAFELVGTQAFPSGIIFNIYNVAEASEDRIARRRDNVIMNTLRSSFRADAEPAWYTNHTSTVLVALFFAMVGLDKFTGGYWVDVFTKIGVGQWFRYCTGCIQITGAVLLVIRKTWLIGGLMLAGTMAGAMVAQVRLLEGWGAAVIPAGLLVLVLVVTGSEFADRRERRLSAEVTSRSHRRPPPNRR